MISEVPIMHLEKNRSHVVCRSKKLGDREKEEEREREIEKRERKRQNIGVKKAQMHTSNRTSIIVGICCFPGYTDLK